MNFHNPQFAQDARFGKKRHEGAHPGFRCVQRSANTVLTNSWRVPFFHQTTRLTPILTPARNDH